MRAAGIPTRVVAGYLGGERNPFGNYYIVRQSDAHAWVEAWLPAKGWTRIDPTTVVVPQRMDQGMAESLPIAERPAYLKFTYLTPIFRSWKKIQLGWDAANVHWSRWIIGYTYRRQNQLFFNLGLGSKSWSGIIKTFGILLFAAAIVVLLFLAGRREPRRLEKDPVREAYDRFCRKLSRVGIERKPAQGPLDFARQIGETRTDLSHEVADITQRYIDIRYGTHPEKTALQTLNSMVKRFKPSKMGPSPRGTGP
jgi:hypothetical protein